LAHRARALLSADGLDVDYHEFPGGHEIDRACIPGAILWLGAAMGGGALT
jgi:predicted esterase